MGRPPGADAEARECLRARGTASGRRRVYGRQAPRAAGPQRRHPQPGEAPEVGGPRSGRP